jgi:hypothetical protein
MKTRKQERLISARQSTIKHSPAEKPLSLAPLSFEDAVEGLLRVKTDKSSLRPSKKP